ncbi:MAG: hypothetical protein EZS28_048647, partial [Streblomastix strix]
YAEATYSFRFQYVAPSCQNQLSEDYLIPGSIELLRNSGGKFNSKHHYVKTIPYSKYLQIDDDARKLLFAIRLYKT